jgi:hypothetical protein
MARCSIVVVAISEWEPQSPAKAKWGVIPPLRQNYLK